MTPEHKEAIRKGREAAAAKRALAQNPQMDIDGEAPPARTPVHEPTRTPLRSKGKTEAIGRGGEVLSRKRTASGDIFDIPKALIPDGWSYQWCAVSVVGNTEILLDQNLMFAENGWRPVPADRYPGKFMPVGHKGNIIRGGQMLMERPTALCDEATAEDVRNAKQLISDRNDSLKLSGMKRQMGDGFEMSQKYRGTGGDIRMSIDRALDAPVPSHTLAEPSE